MTGQSDGSAAYASSIHCTEWGCIDRFSPHALCRANPFRYALGSSQSGPLRLRCWRRPSWKQNQVPAEASMGPKGYPACILFYFAIAVSFLAVGRVALHARDYAETSTSSVGNLWRSKVIAAGADVRSLPSLTAERKPRPPSLRTPTFRPSDPAKSFLATQPFVTALPPSVAHSVPANFLLPITFEPAAASPGPALQYVGCCWNPAGSRSSSQTRRARLPLPIELNSK
jgi:hypothetical protein